MLEKFHWNFYRSFRGPQTITTCTTAVQSTLKCWCLFSFIQRNAYLSRSSQIRHFACRIYSHFANLNFSRSSKFLQNTQRFVSWTVPDRFSVSGRRKLPLEKIRLSITQPSFLRDWSYTRTRPVLPREPGSCRRKRCLLASKRWESNLLTPQRCHCIEGVTGRSVFYFSFI